MEVVGIIPARLESERLPRKLLLKLGPYSIIQRVYLQARQARLLDQVWVSTDSELIRSEIEKIGGKAILSSPHHQSGTDRVAETACELECSLVVNIQGDEPFIPPGVIDDLITMMKNHPEEVMGTVATPFDDLSEVSNPNRVKVVLDKSDHALYFSRAVIPFPREKKETVAWRYLLHCGIYIYRKSFLEDFTSLALSTLEQVERLEQLRALENGYRIKVLVVERYDSFGIDTEKDYTKALEYIKSKGEKLV